MRGQLEEGCGPGEVKGREGGYARFIALTVERCFLCWVRAALFV